MDDGSGGSGKEQSKVQQESQAALDHVSVKDPHAPKEAPSEPEPKIVDHIFGDDGSASESTAILEDE